LNPMPILIGADEWSGIEVGLIERANLLEAVIADIYGPQKLLADGHVPAALISGSPNFARRMVGMKPKSGHYLHAYAVDLVRGPTGDWRVLGDRVRLPVGIGYTLENRLAMVRATGSLLASIGTRRQQEFFDAFRLGIAADCERADPKIGLLTPGRFNQSYPEQAHLARHLGFSLVEGRDLVVRDAKLFVRTIAGLKRIDALWRWIGTRNIDPLAFDAQSEIGVPDLISACESGGLVLANWPGVGVMESRAMSAFLPRLSRIIDGKPLTLPNVATWWCGQDKEREHVVGNLRDLVISSAFRASVPGLPGGRTRPGSALSDADMNELLEAMQRRPMDYVGQQLVKASTTPCLVGGRIEPRHFTIRAYLARNADGDWVTLPGGFGRVSHSGDLRTTLVGADDYSADVCIVESKASQHTLAPPKLSPPAIRRADGVLPSQAADNLFWLGRYGERCHQTARVVRTLLETGSGRPGALESGTAAERLTTLLQAWGAAPTDVAQMPVIAIAAAALSDAKRPGSVLCHGERTQQVALLLRDRLTRDVWRVIQRSLPRFNRNDADSLAAAADKVIERFAALARLTADSMAHLPSWRFLDMGISIERGALILDAAQKIVPGSASAEDLTALLELIDGTSLYRGRYLTMPFIAPVLDMVLLDPQQPRGLAFQAIRLAEHLSALPSVREDGMIEAPLLLARQLVARLEGLNAERLDAATVSSIGNDIAALSDAIGQRYFLQAEAPVPKDGAALLA
ncbi:MAG: circularly permuted type 2 ATP-grasp protein, partial [Novosphingobium sp.]|nr:circularly permuted type 2 ATP-grasp protein [Novosphingobium sp.]